jgi:membrane-bound lytic murein transglycosylase MltF
MAPRTIGAATLLCFAVVGAGATSLLLFREPLPPPAVPQSPSPVTEVRPVEPRERRQWRVQVDGWSIEVDQVGKGYLAALDQAIDQPEEEEFVAPDRTSPYAGLIAKYTRAAGLDWRLVAALIAEESGFRPDVESEAGAYGLMQIRPIAARDVGETDYQSPQANIRTGVRYLKRLDRMFIAADERDRLALVLAAYHMGPAHVADAQELARQHGYDPLRWYGSVEALLPLLEEPAIYPELPSGFARGRQTVGYVDRVLRRYDLSRREFAGVHPAPEAAAVSAR